MSYRTTSNVPYTVDTQWDSPYVVCQSLFFPMLMLIQHSYQPSSASTMSGRKYAYKEKTFFEKSWPFKVAGKSKTESLQPNNYEWPFDCILQGGLPESIEGLKDAWIIYRLKAEIGRRRAKDIIVRKPLRIVRTLDSSALELAHAMVSEKGCIQSAFSPHSVQADHVRVLIISGQTKSSILSAYPAKRLSSAHTFKSTSNLYHC